MSERTELETADAPRPDRCETCRFWTEETDDGKFGGLCWRYPPVLNVLTVEQESDASGFTSEAAADLRVSWNRPRVDSDDWCGEWQAKDSRPFSETCSADWLRKLRADSMQRFGPDCDGARIAEQILRSRGEPIE